jgi:hypothetical protein
MRYELFCNRNGTLFSNYIGEKADTSPGTDRIGTEQAEIAWSIIMYYIAEFLRLVLPIIFFGYLGTAISWPLWIRESGMSVGKKISWKKAGFGFEGRDRTLLLMFS